MYTSGRFITPVPIPIAAGAAPGGRPRRRMNVAAAIRLAPNPSKAFVDFVATGKVPALRGYTSEYIGDGMVTEYVSDYVGDHYDDVVHAQPGSGVHRRRSRRALQLAGYTDEQLGIFGIKIGGSVGKALKKVDQTRLKATKAVGKVVTSTAGKAILGTVLAATGVGIPLAAAIGAGTQAAGTAAKGGKLKDVAKAAAGGAAIGAGGAIAGKVVRGVGGAVAKRVAAGRAAKALPASTSSPLDTLSQQIPGVSVLPSTAGAMPVIKEISDAPVNVLAAEDQTPSTQKRVKGGSIAGKVNTAKKVLATGTAAKAKANKAADVADAAAKKASKLSQALEFAKKAGDTLGISQLSSAAQAAQNVADNASAAASTAADQARSVGNAAEGAAQGAVGGGVLGPIGEFISNNKPLVYGVVALTGGVVLISLLRPRPTMRVA